MKTSAFICAAFAAAALAACSTSPVRPGAARSVPPDRLYINTALQANDGIVIVVRDTGMVGSGCAMGIYLDDHKAALLASGEKAEFPVSSGEHMLSAKLTGRGLCGLRQSRANERRLIFDSAAGKKLDFRVGSDSNGATILYQSSL